jgi:hypothetical protein
VIITDLDIVGIIINKPKADTPLVIDGDGVLSLSVTFECMKTVPGWNPQIIQPGGQVYI